MHFFASSCIFTFGVFPFTGFYADFRFEPEGVEMLKTSPSPSRLQKKQTSPLGLVTFQTLLAALFLKSDQPQMNLVIQNIREKGEKYK